MENTNTFASIITENRYLTDQLTASEFKPNEWKNYRQLCKVMVDSAEAVYHNSADFTDFDLALVGLFAMFGMNDATKGIFKYRVRLAVACLQFKKQYSDAYKDARKALAVAKKTRDAKADAITEDMTEESNPEEFEALAEAESKVAELADTLDTLASEPHNVWWDVVPLTAKNGKDLGIVRKHIEDTIADILFERSNMTEEDFRIEKGQLDGGRKVAEQIKKESK